MEAGRASIATVPSRQGLGPADVLAELHRREGIAGLDEKAARKT